MAGSSPGWSRELVGLCWWWGGVRVLQKCLVELCRPKASPPLLPPKQLGFCFLLLEFVLVFMERVGSLGEHEPHPTPLSSQAWHTLPDRFFLPSPSPDFALWPYLRKERWFSWTRPCGCWGPGVQVA